MKQETKILKKRMVECDMCDVKMNRDVNASRNITTALMSMMCFKKRPVYLSRQPRVI